MKIRRTVEYITKKVSHACAEIYRLTVLKGGYVSPGWSKAVIKESPLP